MNRDKDLEDMEHNDRAISMGYTKNVVSHVIREDINTKRDITKPRLLCERLRSLSYSFNFSSFLRHLALLYTTMF